MHVVPHDAVHAPARVVPLDEGTLLVGGFDRLHVVRLVEGVHVFDKQGVQVSGRHRAGDLAAFHQDDVPAGGLFLGHVEGVVVPFADMLSGGLSFDVVGDGDRVEPLFPGFLHAQGRPDDPVGEDGMDMEIAFQQLVSVDLRQAELPACLHTLFSYFNLFGQGHLLRLHAYATCQQGGKNQYFCLFHDLILF